MTQRITLTIVAAALVLAGSAFTVGHADFPEDSAAVEGFVNQLSVHREMLETFEDIVFSPEYAAMIYIGAIKDDLKLAPEQAAEHLEEVLAQTKTLGLRNSIRMSLKDVYIQTGDTDKCIKLVKEGIAENDKALQEEIAGHDDD